MSKSAPRITVYAELLEQMNKERVKFLSVGDAKTLNMKLGQAILVGEAFLLAMDRYIAGEIPEESLRCFALEFRRALKLTP